MRIFSYSFLPALALLASCAGEARRTDTTTPPPRPEVAAPGTVRIVGTIVAISDERSTDPASPCGQDPCVATVRVDTVIAAGAGFPRAFAQGAEVSMEFIVTLRPTTAERFPSLTNAYPGLDVGARFRAVVSYRPAPTTAPGRHAYVVSDYSVVKP